MAQATAPGTAVQRLIGHLFGGATDYPLAEEMAAWLTSSARFRAFAEEHRDKIRKKLRSAMDDEARMDVRAELRAAHLLLADRRIKLAFEAYGSGNRGPDFTVTFRGERSFNLEVTRSRRGSDAASAAGVLLTKLRQLPPSMPNALVIAIDGTSAESLDIAAASRGLRARADSKEEEAFFVTRGFKGTREFYQRYLRLGAVLVWCEAAPGDARATLWSNRSARIALPARAERACVQCLRVGDD